jgi:predicted nuclease of predicted toxin-antitoxin system
VRDLGLRDANDAEIFQAARQSGAIVMTKDRDFVVLLDRFGPPPQILWVTCGNTSNARLTKILGASFPQALQLLEQGEPLIEITDQYNGVLSV